MKRTFFSGLGGCVILLMALFVCACANYQAPVVSQSMTQGTRFSVKYLQRGYDIHQAKCAKCHFYQDPAKHSVSELRDEIMPSMAKKSKLSDADGQAVLDYLIVARSNGPQVPEESPR